MHLLRVHAVLPPPSTVFEEQALPITKQLLHDNTPTFFVSQVPPSVPKVLMKAPGPQPCFGLHVKVILYLIIYLLAGQTETMKQFSFLTQQSLVPFIFL